MNRILKLIYWTLTLQIFAKLRERRAAKRLRESGLFDASYYRQRYPDIRESGVDPVIHYLRHGADEERDPNPLFDTGFYVRQNPDVAEAGVNPLLHYLESGAREERDPNPLFDTKFYLRSNPSLAGSGANPLLHYLKVGSHSGRDPNPLFDSAWYLATYPEVSQLGVNPLAHYLEQEEGGNPHGVPQAQARCCEGDTPRPTRRNFDPSGERLPDLTRDLTAKPWSSIVLGSSPAAAISPRLLAFYLPQFHPIAENDRWWGEGFTEWTNVTAAKPQFPDHYQPRLPSDLGFYDLRVPEIREQQAQLARRHGIHGFCYYYYWFRGRRILERPLEEVLSSGSPDFPFCICWANENWTRRWDGLEDEVLLEQRHSLASDYQFIRDVIPILKDSRYITVDGAPLLLVYRADKLDDPEETAALWRDACQQAGVPGLHLCAVQFRVEDPRPLGFDAAVEFPPHHFPAPEIASREVGAPDDFEGQILDYVEGIENWINRPKSEYTLYRTVSPGWDNTPRRGRWATIFHGVSPQAYEIWLDAVIEQAVWNHNGSGRFVFINAWNEWAEGAYLEPDRKWGRAFLEATQRVAKRFAPAETNRPAGHHPTPADPNPGQPARQVKSQQENPPLRADRVDSLRAQWKPADQEISQPSSSAPPLLFVSHDAAAAGAQFVLLELLEQLARRRDLRPYVVLLAGGVLEPKFERSAPTLNLERVSANGRDPNAILKDIIAGLQSQGLAVAVCNTVVSCKAAEFCKKQGLGILTLIHEQPSSIDAMFGGRKTIERIEHCSNRIVTVSEFARRSLIDRYALDEGKLSVIRPPLRTLDEPAISRTEARRRILGSKARGNETCIVLGCGTLYPRKGPDLFVELARKVLVKESRTPYLFLWVGGHLSEEYRAQCESAARSADLWDRLRFLGPHADLSAFFQAADIFALTSREDPFPLVNMEAMSFGLPVVAFAETGGAPELIAEDAGVVVPHLDVSAMAEAVCELAEDRTRRKSLGQRGIEKVRAGFRPERYAAEFVELLQRHFAVEGSSWQAGVQDHQARSLRDGSESRETP